MIYDVIVVGSGPGGAAAAATLAKARKSVLLLDRATFPRDKICGDGIPARTLDFIADHLDFDTQSLLAIAQTTRNLTFEAPSGTQLSVVIPPDRHDTICMPRFEFDQLLHQHALKQGAAFEVMQVARPLYEVDQQTGTQRVVGVVERRGQTTIEHEARVVIAADGASSAIAASVRTEKPDRSAVALGIRAYARTKQPLPDAPSAYFFYLQHLVPGYAWIFPIGRHRVNVGVAVFDQAIYKAKGQNLQLLLQHFIEHDGAAYGLEVEPDTIHSWPIPFWTGLESRVAAGAYLVGDAGSFVDPLTGGGIHTAIVTGHLAACSVIELLDGNKTAPEAALAFDATWRGGVGQNLKRYAQVQKYVGSKPRVFNSIVGLAKLLPPIRYALLNAMAGEHA